MPVLVQWLLDVLPKMGNVVMLVGFLLLIFGIVGMELFKGALHYRCALPGYDEASSGDDLTPYDLQVECNPTRPDSCATAEAPGAHCRYFDTNPSFGTLSFDSVALGTISLVQAITFDDWATPMYALMESYHPAVWLFFVVIVLVGGFTVTNLFLSVIFLEFGHSRDQIAAEMVTAAKRAVVSSSAGATGAEGAEGSALLAEGAQLSDGGLASSPDAVAIGMRRWWIRLCDCGTPSEDGLRRELAAVARSRLMGALATLLVLVNMLIMCLPYQGMSDEYAAQLESWTSLITWVFISEMGIKLIGFGCAAYWADGWNAIDGVIVLMSISEMVLTALLQGQGVKLSFLRILRMLRVLRVLRLMRSWKGLYEVTTTLLRALPQMTNVVFLICLAIFMFALLGMQLFGGIYTPSTGYSSTPCPLGGCAGGLLDKPFYHFDYCGPAMLTIFVMITGEWVEASHAAAGVLGPSVNFFFIPIVLIGKFVLMNLLVAIILTEFAERPVSADESQEPSSARDGESSMKSTATKSVLVVSPGEEEEGGAPPPPPVHRWPADYNLCCFAPKSGLRVGCTALLRSPWFDRVILTAIACSSFALAVDTPRLDLDGPLAAVLGKLDLVFTVLFFSEMCIKVVSFGFVLGEGAYLHSFWNQLDFTIVTISLLVLLADEISELGSLRVLRVLRVLRPLRLVSRNAGMRLIITSLFKAMPGVSNVFGVVLSLQIVFAILGMQLFSGELASCASDPALGTREECLAAGGLWKNPPIGSFDDFWSAMRLLYVMSSGDDWAVPMYRMMGTVGVDVAPARDDFSAASLYSVAWMCIGFIFAINLFVGVVVDNFSRMQKEEHGQATMTMEQQQWVATVKAMLHKLPSRAVRVPEGKFRRAVFRLVTTTTFDGIISAVIMANVTVMALDYWQIERDEARYTLYEEAVDFFTWVFYAECAMKIFAMGAAPYFGDNWCRFDFFLVFSAAVDDVLQLIQRKDLAPLPPMLLRVMRIARVLRILRLLKSARGLRDLIITMILSFPALVNVGSLLALIIYIYAILGVQLFTFLALNEKPDDFAGGINDERNFNNMGSTSLLLFQCLTQDGWSQLMTDAMLDEDSGLCSAERGDCGHVAAVPYFISFQVLGSFIFLNLIVAVILDNFSTLHNVNPNLISASDLEVFADAWSTFDPDATNYIPADLVPFLLQMVPRPLGLKGKSQSQAMRLCMRLSLSKHGSGLVSYHELIEELVENNYFRSGMLQTGSKVDARSFKLAASDEYSTFKRLERPPVPQVDATEMALATVPDIELRRLPSSLDDHAARDLAMTFAYQTIGDAVVKWKQRADHRLEATGIVSYALEADREGGAGTLGDALGVQGVFASRAEGLPPAVDMSGGVSRLGWLRCDRQKRWVRVGAEFLEVWAEITSHQPARQFLWTKWAVLGLELDLERHEPAVRVTLQASLDAPTRPGTVEGRTSVLLQAYHKESEPTREERRAHLAGFVDELRRHMVSPNAEIAADLSAELGADVDDAPSPDGLFGLAHDMAAGIQATGARLSRKVASPPFTGSSAAHAHTPASKPRSGVGRWFPFGAGRSGAGGSPTPAASRALAASPPGRMAPAVTPAVTPAGQPAASTAPRPSLDARLRAEAATAAAAPPLPPQPLPLPAPPPARASASASWDPSIVSPSPAGEAADSSASRALSPPTSLGSPPSAAFQRTYV